MQGVHKALLDGHAYRFSHGIGDLMINYWKYVDGVRGKIVDWNATNKRKKEILDAGLKLYDKEEAEINYYSNNNEILEKIKEYCNKHSLKAEFLSYHEYGKEKWKTEYKIKDGFVTKEKISEFTDLFEKSGLTVVKT